MGNSDFISYNILESNEKPLKSLIIIDNFNKENEKFFKRFTNSLSPLKEKVNWEFIHYSNLQNEEIIKQCLAADGIILTGSYEMASKPEVKEKYRRVLQIIKKYTKPLLGICFGHQLIASEYGFDIKQLNHPDYNIEDEKALELEFDGKFPLVNKSMIWVYETHHEEVVWTPDYEKEFHLHASSENCKIQAVSHRTRQLYGVQFHPENPTHEQAFRDGLELFANFVNLLKN